MGKKKSKQRRNKKEDELFANHGTGKIDFDDVMSNINAKDRGKLSKKMRKKAKKEKKHIEKLLINGKETNGGWNQVTIEVGTNVNKEFLLSSIGSYVDTPFICLGFHKIGTNICFYFESNKDVANAISGLNRRIQSPDGEAMKIHVTSISVPELVLNSNQLQILREVIAKRFNPTSGLLDLTCLHLDPSLLEKDIFVPLNNTLNLKQVIKIINENISNLNALNLSKNKLDNGSLKLLQALQSNTCSLSALNLESNSINSLQFLKFINKFPLHELHFSNNQVQKIIPDPHQHLKLLKKELPSLKMVDGVDIELYSLKCLQNSAKQIPLKQSRLAAASSSLQGNLTSTMTEGHLRTFLDQFYKLLDTHGRPDLWAAYTPTAKFDLTSINPVIPSRLYEGQQEIQQFLSAFPETQHVHSSFNLEILGVTPTEGLAKVTGTCQVIGLPNLVHFERTMKIIPFNSGFCCSLDSLQIR